MFDIHVRYSNNKSNNWCTEKWFNRRLRLPSETPEAIFYGKRQYTTTTDLPALIVLNFYTDLMNSSPENFVCTRQIKEGLINALEFERTQVILGDLYTAIVFEVAHAPYLIPIHDWKMFNLRILSNITGNWAWLKLFKYMHTKWSQQNQKGNY